MVDDRSLIIDAENRRRQALVASDITELSALFEDDLVHVHGSGRVHDKAGLLDFVTHEARFLAVERGPLNVRIWGDMAVVTGTMTNTMVMNGVEARISGMATQVLRRGAAGWRFVSFQFTFDR